SSSSSTVAGVPRSTRTDYSVRRSRRTGPRRKPPGGWPPRRRPLTCRGTRSTLGPPVPRRGCPSTAPGTGCAGSTATSPGTSNCARKPSITVALPCTPTPRTIQGCSGDLARSRDHPALVDEPELAPQLRELGVRLRLTQTFSSSLGDIRDHVLPGGTT